MSELTRCMVFDVESIGLHGQGFAVGWVLVDEAGREIARDVYACSPDLAAGREEDRAWVRAHVSNLEQIGPACTPRDVRNRFWEAWSLARTEGATLWADCGWPVEARFLASCIYDDLESRQRSGPYPLHEIATVRLVAGEDPLTINERLPSERPKHNPLSDARQSARLLIAALHRLRPQTQGPQAEESHHA